MRAVSRNESGTAVTSSVSLMPERVYLYDGPVLVDIGDLQALTDLLSHSAACDDLQIGIF